MMMMMMMMMGISPTKLVIDCEQHQLLVIPRQVTCVDLSTSLVVQKDVWAATDD